MTNTQTLPAASLSFQRETKSLSNPNVASTMRKSGGQAGEPLQFLNSIATGFEGVPVAKILSKIENVRKTDRLLICVGAGGVDFGSLVRLHLDDYEGLLGRKIVFSGPSAGLKPLAARYLGLAFHELLENALGGEAFSRGDGVIQIQWQVIDDPSEPHFALKWSSESEGCHIGSLVNGFAYRFLTDELSRAFDAVARWTYGSRRAAWHFTAPAGVVLQRKEKRIR